jgi:predicted lipoprotein
MKRAHAILIGLAILGLFFWCFPPFHLVPLGQAKAQKQQSAFNAGASARIFWAEQLLPALDQAADASVVLDAMAANPQSALEKFGRSFGMSRASYLLLSGRGSVVSAGPEGLGISLGSSQDRAGVLLLTGLVFGNAVRDASGLLEVSDFPNSQHFNEISAELNRIVETEVIARLKEQAALGRQLLFIGCAEVTPQRRGSEPLKLIPLRFKWEDA